GEYGPALSLLNDAQKLAQEIGDKAQLTACLIYRGRVRRHLGDFVGAETALREAERLGRDMNNAPLLAESLVEQASLLLKQGQRSRAHEVSKEAVARATDAGDHRLILLTRLQAAEAAGSVRDLESAAANATQSGLTPLGAAAHLALARVHLNSGHAEDARTHAEQVIKMGASINLRDVLFQAHHLEG